MTSASLGLDLQKIKKISIGGIMRDYAGIAGNKWEFFAL
jgi:hypothetical protein